MTDDQLKRIEWLIETGHLLLKDNQVSHAGLADWQQEALKTQLSLQQRSAARFPDPERWLWTDRSLSQSSDWWSAHFKASLFPEDSVVVDACCGAGVDSVALSARTSTLSAVDRDLPTLLLAGANVRSHGGSVNLVHASFEDLNLNHSWLHIDPDRRSLDRKLIDPSAFSPPLEQILDRLTKVEGAVIKLAPGSQLSITPANSIRVWLGSQGTARQQLLISGGILSRLEEMAGQGSCGLYGAGADPQSHVAVLMTPTNESLTPLFFRGPPADETRLPRIKTVTSDSTLKPGQGYVYDLHPVLHASGLTEAFAFELGLTPIHSRKGFFLSDRYVDNPWLQAFELLDFTSWDDRKVRKLLRAKKAGTVEVKCRLTKLDANHFQRRYSQPDGTPICLMITQVGQRVRCLFTRRIASGSATSNSE